MRSSAADVFGYTDLPAGDSLAIGDRLTTVLETDRVKMFHDLQMVTMTRKQRRIRQIEHALKQNPYNRKLIIELELLRVGSTVTQARRRMEEITSRVR